MPAVQVASSTKGPMTGTKRTEKGKKSETLILFSRLPINSETKTRLSPLLDERQKKALHQSFWADAFADYEIGRASCRERV